MLIIIFRDPILSSLSVIYPISNSDSYPVQGGKSLKPERSQWALAIIQKPVYRSLLLISYV
jgi:hypothetical protein